MTPKTVRALLSGAALATALVWPAGVARPDSLRVEVGLGAQWGEPEIEFNGASDTLETTTGLAGSLAIWVDQAGVGLFDVD
jgi:hypothetical protein